MVGAAGFEPATPASRTQCSTGLSHAPTRWRLIASAFAHCKEPDLRILPPSNRRSEVPAPQAANSTRDFRSTKRY